jgi:hypothetical protein
MWVRQGRTDAWIAHKLDVSIEQLERFKRDHSLETDGAAPGRPADPLSVPPPEEIDLYAEQEAEVAEVESRAEVAEPEPEADDEEPEAEDEEPEAEADGEAEKDAEKPATRDRGRRPRMEREDEADETDEERAASARRRRRGRRGGRRRRRPSAYEATFDHGEEGYGLWLDPAVVENPVYTEHWAGHRAVIVTFDRDAITIRRANGADAEAGDEDSEGAQ